MRAALVLALALGGTAADAPLVSLADAIAHAHAHSPVGQSAQRLAEGAAQAERFSGRLLNPLVDVRIENLGTTHDVLPYDIFAVASQTVEIGGKRSLRRSLAGADLDVARSAARWTDRQIDLRVLSLYATALRARGLVDALASHRAGMSRLIDTMRARVEAGVAAEADLLKFETEAVRLDLDLTRAGLDLDRSLAALSFTIGLQAPLVAVQLVEPEVPAVPSLGDAADLSRHPEMAAALARRRRFEQVAALEHARRLPDPIISAGYKRTGGYDTGVASLTMTLPLFDRNASAAARTAGEARAAAADAQATSSRLESERVALVTAAQALQTRLSGVPSAMLGPAESVRNAARAELEEGTADVLKVIDAERVHADVQRVALDLRLDALLVVIEARLALGLEMLP